MRIRDLIEEALAKALTDYIKTVSTLDGGFVQAVGRAMAAELRRLELEERMTREREIAQLRAEMEQKMRESDAANALSPLSKYRNWGGDAQGSQGSLGVGIGGGGGWLPGGTARAAGQLVDYLNKNDLWKEKK